MQSWDDDAAVFYERSLGEIVNGAELPSGAASRRTGALYVASNLPATPVTADDGGWVEVRYGEDGNALAVTVHGQCGDPSLNSIPLDCRPSGSSDPAEAIALSCAYSCAAEQHFTYAWDEVNRVHHARRFDRSGGASWELAVEQRYLYDASNQRTVKTTTFRGFESGTERTALYVYPGDYERRGLQTTFDRTSYEAISGDTETQYGVGGARIVWRTGTRDDGLDRDQRITLALTDLIQSTTAVIDLATGELVETGSYYANGARETYRSNASETVAPEPMGFTGKEADEEVGLTYFGQRYLMAHLGRWASPDPLQTHAVSGGEAVNGYHYVAGNLLQGRDPVGLQDDPCVSAGACRDSTPSPDDNCTSVGQCGGWDPLALTMLREGDIPRTLSPHRPNAGRSGVTIGYGYDVVGRTPQDIQRDFARAGIPAAHAQSLAGAAGLAGSDAQAYFDRNRSALSWQITPQQRSGLLWVTFTDYVSSARSRATHGSAPISLERWSQLDQRVITMLADLTYVGAPYAGERAARINTMLADESLGTLDQMFWFRDYVSQLPEGPHGLQGPAGRQARLRYLDDQITQLVDDVVGRYAEQLERTGSIMGEFREPAAAADGAGAE